MRKSISKMLLLFTSLAISISLFANQGAANAVDFTQHIPDIVPSFYTLLYSTEANLPVYTYLIGDEPESWRTLYRVYGTADNESLEYFDADALGVPTTLTPLELSTEAEILHFEYAVPNDVPQYYVRHDMSEGVPPVYYFNTIDGNSVYRVFGKVAGKGENNAEMFFDSDINGVPNNRIGLIQVADEEIQAYNTEAGSAVGDSLTSDDEAISVITADVTQNDTPQVEWHFTDVKEDWVFDESQSIMADIPVTGDTNVIFGYMLVSLIAVTVIVAVYNVKKKIGLRNR